MTSTTATLRPDPETLELLLMDREWVTREFEEIMAASGLDERIIVATLPGSSNGGARRTRAGLQPQPWGDRIVSVRRVRPPERSPPERAHHALTCPEPCHGLRARHEQQDAHEPSAE